MKKKKYIYLLEIVIGLSLLMIINLIWFRGNPGYIHTQPHPFWIIILLIASRYGTVPGVVAAILSSLLYWISLFPLKNFAHVLALNQSEYLFTPMLFILVGGIIGEVREKYKREFDELNTKHNEITQDLEDLAVRYMTLEDTKKELEKRIVGQISTVNTLYESAKALESLDTEELYPAVLDMVVKCLGVEECSIYLVEGESLKLKVQRGWKEGEQRTEILPIDEGPMGRVIQEKKMVTLNSLISKEGLPGYKGTESIMCAPLLTKDDSVLGIVNVEKIPFLQFTPSTVRMFSMIVDWASTALANALDFQRTKDKNIEDEITGAYSYRYIQKRLNEEFIRARRHKLPLSVILIKINGYERILPDKRANVLSVLGWVFSHKFRDTDIIAKYARDDMFVIILPITSEENAKIVLGKLLGEIEAFSFKPFEDEEESLTVLAGIGSIDQKKESYLSMFKEAEESLLSRELAPLCPDEK